MAGDLLTVEINPVIMAALSIKAQEGGVDYYGLLGITPQTTDDAAVDAAVLSRTKELRRWQNSPQHGDEVVKLLPLLHRVAKILKDPKRREAYAEQLSRIRRGEVGDPLDDFRDMVRAALVDGAIDNKSKTELLRYAEQNSIDQAEAGRILREYATAAGAGAVSPAAGVEEFEVRQGGPAEFRAMLQELLIQGRLTRTAGEKALQSAAKFGIQPGVAANVLNEVRREHFQSLVRRVADGGVISNNQARLLMPKAEMIGLAADAAYEIISQYTFTGASQDDLAQMSLISAGFEASEIEHLLSKQETVVYSPTKAGIAERLASVGKVLLALGLLGGVAYGAYWGWGIAMQPPPVEVVATPTATPTPTPVPDSAWRPPVADPASGFLLFEPSEPGDPPAFEAGIHEVTCAEYREFLVANLYPVRPPGWGLDFSHPAGQARRPVTGVSAGDAKEYCKWRAKKLKIEVSRVRLPTEAELRRMLRARTPDGLDPRAPDFWGAAGLAAEEARDVQTRKSDTLLFPQGQIYDLVGNVSEWATDAEGGHVIFGGNYSMGSAAPDLSSSQPAVMGEGSPRVGFRILISPPAHLE